MHAKLAASSTTWTTGLAPLGHISWPKFRPFSVDSGAFSIVAAFVMSRPWGLMGRYTGGWGARNGREKAGKLDGWEEQFAKKGCNTEDFPGGHPSYGATGGTSNLPGGVTLRTGGATPRAAYAREARRELHDVRQLGLPRCATFRGPNFAVFGGFRRGFRSLAAFVMSRPWGLRGRYTGVGGVRNGREKQEAGRVGGAFRKKGCNTRTSQGVTHPSTTLAQARLTSEF
ncbi:UNVERIFIED_CONTAM: hypothetical protein Sindi_2919200 [Sesamum indicum]